MKTNIKIAYIGGGSRAWARKLMSDLALDTTLSGSVSLYDIDFDAALDNEKIGNMITAHPSSKANWKYTAVRTIDEALSLCDVVIISILPATFKEMQSDVHTPERYNVYQSVGDSTGLGGLIRAMRSAPMFEFFGQKIKEICPNALVINYTNPMTICTRILTNTFKDIKIIGCCHEVFGTQQLLAKMVAESEGIKEPSRDSIKVDIAGINHFTWITKAEYKGKSLFPMFNEFADKCISNGYLEEGLEDGIMMCKNIIKFEMFKKYGVIPAAGDRHLAEFFNGQWYLKSPDHARQKGFNLTPVSWRIDNQEKLIKETKDILSGKVALEVEPSGEEGVRQIKAFLGHGDLVTNVNTANIGQMHNYPIGAIVETNAKIMANTVQPIKTAELPPEVNAMVLRHVYHYEAFIKAMERRDAQAVKNIIADSPQATCLDFGMVDELFKEMYSNTSSYLDFYWK